MSWRVKYHNWLGPEFAERQENMTLGKQPSPRQHGSYSHLQACLDILQAAIWSLQVRAGNESS